jgi:hypothetical protein
MAEMATDIIPASDNLMEAMEDTMQATYDKVAEAHEGQDVETGETETDETSLDNTETPGPEGDETETTSEDSQEEKGEQADEKTNQKEEAAGQDVQDSAEGEPNVSEAPTTWRTEAKDLYESLPFEVKTEIHKREQDFFKGIEQYKEKAGFGETIERVVKPYEMLLKSSNTSPEQAIDVLMRTAAMLRVGSPDQKKELILNMARNHGVDLTTNQDGESDQFVDPGIKALQDEITQLKGMLHQGQSTQQQNLQNDISTAIDTFSKNPDNEFFDEVRSTMGGLIQSGVVTGKTADELIQNAYNHAIKLDENVSKKLTARQKQKEESERIIEAKKKAKKAKRSTGTNVKTSGQGVNRSKPESIDETMSRAYDNAQKE